MHMMNIRRAFAGIGAGLLALLLTTTAGATTAAPKTDDCRIVAPADRTLCHTVQHQTAYTYLTHGGNLVGIPNGRTLVHSEVTHAGLTRHEMHDALTGYAHDYAQHTDGQAVTLDMDSLRDAYGTDARLIVSFHDTDGKPGGKKTIRVRADLP